MRFGSQDAELPATTDVVYIASLGRSGSTLLGSLLGQLPGAVFVGEMRGVWRAALYERLCGCGVPFRECEFWRAVGDAAGHGWDSAFAERALRLDQEVCRHRTLLRRAAHRADSQLHSRLLEYRSNLVRLYDAIAEVAEAQVVIDTSKDPVYGSMLTRDCRVRVRVVHLVRDARGVAYSRQKVIARPETVTPGGDQLYLPRSSVARCSLEWLVENSLIETRLFPVHRYVRVRYEDLAQSPASELSRLLSLAGMEQGDHAAVERLRGNRFFATRPHAVGGNPMQVRAGKTIIAVDDNWRCGGLTRPQRVLACAIAWPLLLRYGYIRASLTSVT